MDAPEKEPPLLQFRHLTVEAFQPETGWHTVIHDFNLTVETGEVVALIGESGGGKTTIGLCALGYTRPGMRITNGEILFRGRDVRAMGAEELRRFRGAKVAYVAQSAAAALNPAMAIGTQIREGMYRHGTASKEEAAERCLDLLGRLNLPDPKRLAERYPQQTSGGQQQRVMMAMAMACGPELLVLDEPTTALDVTTQVQVLHSIKNAIADFGASALYVSHDLAVVSQIATRIVVLRNGRAVEEGPTFDVLHRPSDPYTRTLLGAVRKLPEPSEAVAALEARAVEPCVSVRQVRATYHRRGLFRRTSQEADVLHDVSLDVYPGEVLAVVGESGSGKSTLARVIAGLHPPSGGDVLHNGRVISRSVGGRDRDCLRRIQIVFQSPEQALNPRTTVEEAIGRPLSFYFGMSGAAKRRRLAELLELVDLPASMARKTPREMSGGQRQRVAIARAFAAEPDVILCDEFLSALDTIVAARIVELMASLRDRLGTAYVFISHDLATVAALADRVAVMKHGRLVSVAPTRNLFHSDRHPYVDQLIRSVPELRPGWLESVDTASA